MIHLVRAANGIDSLREFAVAMRAHPPGVEHELVLAMKGFASRAEAAPYIEETADLDPTIEFFPDVGLDLGLLFGAVARLRRGRYCFVNSHTRPAAAGWLAKLDAALDLPDVGIAGATGCWLSSHSWLTYSMGLPSFYRGVLPPVRRTRRVLLEVDFEQQRIERRSKLDALRTRLDLLSQLPEELLAFAPFPTPHLRNTMLMVRHETLRSLRLFAVRTKFDTYVLESGSLNMVAQLACRGLRALVVDSAGTTMSPPSGIAAAPTGRAVRSGCWRSTTAPAPTNWAAPSAGGCSRPWRGVCTPIQVGARDGGGAHRARRAQRARYALRAHGRFSRGSRHNASGRLLHGRLGV